MRPYLEAVGRAMDATESPPAPQPSRAFVLPLQGGVHLQVTEPSCLPLPRLAGRPARGTGVRSFWGGPLFPLEHAARIGAESRRYAIKARFGKPSAGARPLLSGRGCAWIAADP